MYREGETLCPDEGECLKYNGECVLGCECETCILTLNPSDKTIGEMIRESDENLADFYSKSLTQVVSGIWRILGMSEEEIAEYARKFFEEGYVSTINILNKKSKPKEGENDK